MTGTCGLWTDWVQRSARCTDLEGILATCKGVRSGSTTFRPSALTGQLELIDVETEQIEDLTAMRTQPHTVPFRRYLYVGEVSDRARLGRLGQAVELVAADDFAAIFSGVRLRRSLSAWLKRADETGCLTEANFGICLSGSQLSLFNCPPCYPYPNSAVSVTALLYSQPGSLLSACSSSKELEEMLQKYSIYGCFYPKWLSNAV